MIALALQAAAAFNLVCTGTHATGTFGGDLFFQIEREQPTNITFRVDLVLRRWCTGACPTTSPIHSVSDTEIVFWSNEDASIQSETLTMVNTETSELLNRKTKGRFVSLHSGTCERQPFTGFPSAAFEVGL